jgi:hypothetical protein
LLLALATLFAGCETSQSDRAFFQKGWLHPEQGAKQRMNSTEWR